MVAEEGIGPVQEKSNGIQGVNKTKIRTQRWQEIESKSLLGKIIEVIKGTETAMRGKLNFYENFMNKNQSNINRGYYVEDMQIPLLKIKEVNKNYLTI